MKKSLLVLFSAILLGLSRLPFYTGWLGFVALIPLLYYFDSGKHKVKELFRDAFIFSAVSFCLWLHWLWGVTASGFVGMILLYTVYHFITFVLIQMVCQRQPKLRYIGFVLIFLTLEYLQNFSELRFPWNNLGYALADYTVLIQAADIGGVALISLLLLISNVFIYLALKGKRQYIIGVVLILGFLLSYGIWCLNSLELTKADAKIAIMQPSIPQSEKWEEEHFDELYQTYVQLTQKAAKDSASLIIWPEAAMPAYILRQTDYLPLVQNLCDNNNLDIFTGFPDILPAPDDYPGEAYYYNSATLFTPYHRYQKPYYKMVLVPVAERMLWLDYFPFMWKLQFGQANWEFGKEFCYYKSSGNVFSPQICFEIAFSELNRKMAFRNLGESTGDKPDKIDYLVNVTNDAWFGKSVGPWVHGMMTKFRAIENRIQIYRSANTGISMIVDPMGRVIGKTKLFDVTLLTAPLYKCSKVPLFYHLYRWLHVTTLLTFILLIYALIFREKKILKTRGQI
jgi:apolipoprotein N-acyltransferase